MLKHKEKKGKKMLSIKISAKDLPLSCPQNKDNLWSLHPLVYLPIAKTKEEVCPYCQQRYVLVR